MNGTPFASQFALRSSFDKLKNFETDLAKIPPASLDVELKVVEYGQYLRYEVERHIKNNLLHWNANDFPTAIDGVKCNKEIADGDLDKIKQELSLPTNTAFERAILMLYFSDKRKEILGKISDNTKKTIKHVYTKINELYQGSQDS